MNPLIDWIESEIAEGRATPNGIATNTGHSKGLYYQVMAGKSEVSFKFCQGISRATGEPLNRILVLAGLLPPPRNRKTQEIIDLCHAMTDQEADEVISFIRWKRSERRPQGITYQIRPNNSRTIADR